MQLDETKHIFLAYGQPKRILSSLVIVLLLLIVLYFYIGRMTFVLWVLLACTVIAFVQALRQLSQRGPYLIINEEGD